MDYSAIVLMIVAGGFGLVGKIVFDWLKNPRAQAPLSLRLRKRHLSV